MKNVQKWLTHTRIGHKMGLRFAGINKAVGVFSDGDFDRVESGFFRINRWRETTTNPIPCTMRMGVYSVPLRTKDDFIVAWHIKVQFIFDLRKAGNPSIACTFTEATLQNIVGTRLEQVMHQHVPEFAITDLNTCKTRAHLTRLAHKFVADMVVPVGITVIDNGVILGQLDLPEAYDQMVEEKHRLSHLKELLAADGELSVEDKLILAFRSAKDQNPDFNPTSMATAMMMMQNMAPKNGPTPPTPVGNGHGSSNGHH